MSHATTRGPVTDVFDYLGRDGADLDAQLSEALPAHIEVEELAELREEDGESEVLRSRPDTPEARDERARQALAHPKRAKSMYLTIANLHKGPKPQRLTHGQFRALFTLARFASPDLTNAFPLRRTMAEELGVTVAAYDALLAQLRKLGWVQTRERSRPNGCQSSSLAVFCIPEGVLPMGAPWQGPDADDNKKAEATRKRRRRTIGRL